MTIFVIDDQMVSVPAWVQDLESFRRWVHSEGFPESGRICFFNGNAWVDMSKEQYFSHNQVKNEFAFVLTGIIKAGRMGRYNPDGMLLTNLEADFTVIPDGCFVSHRSLASGNVRLIEGAQEGIVELVGTPDMVLEVVSSSSVEKDKVTLKELYWEAGISEYWLVDARKDRLEFDIFRCAAKGYSAARKKGGWLKSNVFGKSFRLTRQMDDMGNPEFTLETK